MVRGFVSWCLRHSPAQRRPPPRLLGNLRGNERQAEEGSASVAQLNYVIVLSVNHAVQHERNGLRFRFVELTSLAGATSSAAENVGEPERNFRKSAEGFRFSRTAQICHQWRMECCGYSDLQGTTIEARRIWKKTRGMFNKEKIAKLEKDTQAFRCLFQWLHREGRVHKSGETDERNITSFCEKYKHHILARWLNMKNPTSIGTAKRFVMIRVEKARETVWNFLDYVSLSRVALVSASPQN
ncbi:hypothetical protein OROGR_021255 [Orobanche gracilis]